MNFKKSNKGEFKRYKLRFENYIFWSFFFIEWLKLSGILVVY